MSKWTKFAAVAVAVVMAVGCGDDGGTNGDELTESEKSALVETLTSNTQLGGFGVFAAFVVDVMGEVGTLDAATVNAAINKAFERGLSLSVAGSQASAYDGAVGIAIQFDVTSGDVTESGWFYGVIGWNGINASAGTVDEMVLVGGVGETNTLPSSASGTIENGDVFALYATPTLTYVGTTGEASVSSSSFSGSTDCSESGQGFTVECSYSTGSMNGDFLFQSEEIESGATYTQTKVDFQSLPAVRMIISITE